MFMLAVSVPLRLPIEFAERAREGRSRSVILGVNSIEFCIYILIF
jgi:hypothetical protein